MSPQTIGGIMLLSPPAIAVVILLVSIWREEGRSGRLFMAAIVCAFACMVTGLILILNSGVRP